MVLEGYTHNDKKTPRFRGQGSWGEGSDGVGRHEEYKVTLRAGVRVLARSNRNLVFVFLDCNTRGWKVEDLREKKETGGIRLKVYRRW